MNVAIFRSKRIELVPKFARDLRRLACILEYERRFDHLRDWEAPGCITRHGPADILRTRCNQFVNAGCRSERSTRMDLDVHGSIRALSHLLNPGFPDARLDRIGRWIRMPERQRDL